MTWRKDKQTILLKIAKVILDIEYSSKWYDIRFDCFRDSIYGLMLACGHCATESFDDDEIMYYAYLIVLLKHHRFDVQHSYSKWRAYKLMKMLDIPFDKKMKQDYRKSVKKSLETMPGLCTKYGVTL